MKTKEEILKQEWYKVTSAPFNSVTLHHLSYALEAMQLYSDQQNKELREENGELRKEMDKIKFSLENCDKVRRVNYEDCQRLTKEVERITKISNARAEKLGLAIVVPDEADKDAENTRLRELLGKCQVILEENPVKFLKLLRDLDNALNHKP